MSKCPVCKAECSSAEKECPVCGFPNPIVTFVSQADAEYWMRTVVHPFKKRLKKESLHENKCDDFFDIKGTSLRRYLGNQSHVVIPNGIEHIESFAFCHNPSIHSIYIPSTVQWIANSAFAYCKNLQHIVVDEANEHYYNIKGNEGVFGYGEFLSAYPPGQSVVDIPRGIRKIWEGAYITDLRNCTVKLGSDVVGFDGRCFRGKNVSFIVDPQNPWVTVGSNSRCLLSKDKRKIICYGCNESGDRVVNDIHDIIPPTVDEIESNAYIHLPYKMKELSIPTGVRYIGSHAFDLHSLCKRLYLPDSVEYVGHNAFGYWSSLEYVSVSSSTVFEEDSFRNKSQDIIVYKREYTR